MKEREGIASQDVNVDWSAAEAVNVQPVNVFVAQAAPSHHLLSLGFVAPPIIVSPQDAQRAKSLKRIPAQVVARVVLTPDDMRDLVKVLSGNIAAREKILERGQEQ